MLAAVALAHTERGEAGLRALLKSLHAVETVIDDLPGRSWRFSSEDRRVWVNKVQSSDTRAFQIAYQLAVLPIPARDRGEPARSAFRIAEARDVCHAGALVYADGLDLRGPAAKVGVGCRICERNDCAQRAYPPVNPTAGDRRNPLRRPRLRLPVTPLHRAYAPPRPSPTGEPPVPRE